MRNCSIRGRTGREADRVVVPSKQGNSGGGKGPDLRHAIEDGEDREIDDESRNARQDQEPSEKALWQGEGGARLPLLPAVRQDLPRRHPSPRLCAGSRERGSARRGRGDVRADRGGRRGGVAGGSARGPRLEDVPARAGSCGVPVRQKDAKGNDSVYYVSTTSWSRPGAREDDQSGFPDARYVPYLVYDSAKLKPLGLNLGDLALIAWKGRATFAV